MQAHHLLNIKYGHASTPLTYQKENPKPPSRKLWQKENAGPNNFVEESFDYTPTWMENFDKIESPQYVNFFETFSERKSADRFFDKDSNENVVKPQSLRVQKLPGTDGDNPLHSALLYCSLSKIKVEDNSNMSVNNAIDNKEVKTCTFALPVNTEDEKKKDGGIFQRTTSTPFNFEWKNKDKQKRKEDRVNKQPRQDENTQPIFRANPGPMFIKASGPSTFGKTTTEKTEKTKPNDKITNKVKIWEKEPFRPCLSTKRVIKARTPKLSTASRAQQRKIFDDRMKEREKQVEWAKQLEETAKREHEEMEIARLRRESVHKAQPIRKYKAGLPKVQKRPLTDPKSPLLNKRRRRV